MLRPVARLLVFRRILRRGAFLQMKAFEALFDHACRARAASGRDVASTIFGTVSVAA